jgi:hypothetical protein
VISAGRRRGFGGVPCCVDRLGVDCAGGLQCRQQVGGMHAGCEDADWLMKLWLL